MIRRVINSRSKTIIFSAGLISFSIGISALLGLLRDRLLVTYFDVSQLDVYFAAFRIPDLIYGIIITGGIVAAFLPIFSKTLGKDNEEGWKLTNNTLNVLLLVLLFLCGILFIFTPLVVKILAPGFSNENIEKTIYLTRLMLLSPVLLGVSSIFSGILQYFDRFLAYSLAPILYNIGIIFGILFFVPHFGLVGLAYGVIFGSFLHLFIQVPSALFSGFSYRPVVDLSQKELHRIFYLVLPRIVGQAASKINMIVVTALASLLAVGSISIFNLADHLQAFPVRMIGVAFAVAAFPAFSRSLASKDKEKFLQNFSSVIRQVLFLIIPIMVTFFLLRAHIVRLVLGAEGFGWRETQLTAACLGIFAFSFFTSALVHILVRVFFSFEDTKTPVLVSLVSMAVNIMLCFLFIWVLGSENIFREMIAGVLKLGAITDIEVIAFPLAFLFSTAVHFILLIHFLKVKVGNFRGMGVRKCLQKVLFSSFLMGIVLFITLRIGGSMFELNTFFSVLLQTIVGLLVAALTYIFLAKSVRSPEFYEIKEAFLNNKK